MDQPDATVEQDETTSAVAQVVIRNAQGLHLRPAAGIEVEVPTVPGEMPDDRRGRSVTARLERRKQDAARPVALDHGLELLRR